MTMTHTKRIKQMQSAEEIGEVPPDSAIIVHEWEDGWRMVRIAHCGDARREGLLMRNCLAKYAGDKLDSDNPGQIAERSDRADSDPMEKIREADFEWTDLAGQHIGLQLYSLRDPMNLPHLTFWADPGRHICGVKGFRNTDTPKAIYTERLEEWAKLTDTKIATKSDLYILDTIWAPEGKALVEQFEKLFQMVCPYKDWANTPMGKARLRYIKAWRVSIEQMTAALMPWCAYAREQREIMANNEKVLEYQMQELEKLWNDPTYEIDCAGRSVEEVQNDNLRVPALREEFDKHIADAERQIENCYNIFLQEIRTYYVYRMRRLRDNHRRPRRGQGKPRFAKRRHK